MVKPLIRALFFLLLGILVSTNSLQANDWADKLYFNGFYTLDYTYTEVEAGLISNNESERNYTNSSNRFENSLVGFQLGYEIVEDLTGFSQVTLSYDSQDDPQAKFSWAYLSYDLGADQKVRIGKFQVPYLQGTELRNIGLSRLWARPLIPERGANGFNEFYGAEYIKLSPVNEGILDFQLSAGNVITGSGLIDSDAFGSFALKYGENSYWVRGAFLYANYKIKNTGNINDELDLSDSFYMAGLETEINHQRFLINAGYAIGRSDLLPVDALYYISIGRIVGAFTPYIYAGKRNLHLLGTSSSGLDSLFEFRYHLHTTAVGLRYAISEKMGMKFEIENTEPSNVDTEGNLPDTKGNTFSILLEGVF